VAHTDPRGQQLAVVGNPVGTFNAVRWTSSPTGSLRYIVGRLQHSPMRRPASSRSKAAGIMDEVHREVTLDG
jgi:hypothetical protein